MPFYDYEGKMFCYLWTRKDTGDPYLGIVDGHLLDYPELEQDGRKRMKIFRVDPDKDLPLDAIRSVLDAALALRINRKAGK